MLWSLLSFLSNFSDSCSDDFVGEERDLDECQKTGPRHYSTNSANCTDCIYWTVLSPFHYSRFCNLLKLHFDLCTIDSPVLHGFLPKICAMHPSVGEEPHLGIWSMSPLYCIRFLSIVAGNLSCSFLKLVQELILLPMVLRYRTIWDDLLWYWSHSI